jgi:hypothetical protein
MVVNEYACLLVERGAPEFIAGKPSGASSLLQILELQGGIRGVVPPKECGFFVMIFQQ